MSGSWTQRDGIALAEGLSDFGGQSFWLRASMIGGCGPCPFLVIPWHLPYNWGKARKTSVRGMADVCMCPICKEVIEGTSNGSGCVERWTLTSRVLRVSVPQDQERMCLLPLSKVVNQPVVTSPPCSKRGWSQIPLKWRRLSNASTLPINVLFCLLRTAFFAPGEVFIFTASVAKSYKMTIDG
jgi:hypothetical protein